MQLYPQSFEILAGMKRDHKSKTNQPTHWGILDQPHKESLNDVIFKIFMVPFNGNEMAFHEYLQVKCIYCLETLDILNSDYSKAKAHMNSHHCNAGAWLALLSEGEQISKRKKPIEMQDILNPVHNAEEDDIKWEGSSDTESESEDILYDNVPKKIKVEEIV